MGSYLSGTPKPNSRIPGLTVIVTGANRGVGLQTTKQLYELGATVYMGCRSEENAKEAIKHIRNDVTVSEGELRWLPLDLSTVMKARESAKRFLEMEDKLDVLGKFISRMMLSLPHPGSSQQRRGASTVVLARGLLSC
ncbi:hypothetical protein FRC12_004705 [Ceratobasidium sp. 428]|nr:hypothetical protein FRC12_004705 [Ceratobasidium sp. 428]